MNLDKMISFLHSVLVTVLCLGVNLNTATVDLGNANCPCHIFVNEIGLQIANCQYQNLTSIPECVPATTQWLDFNSNNLKFSPGQFQKFENLTYLDLFYNKEFTTQDGSFQSLFSLRILDLSYTDGTYLNGETFLDQGNLRELALIGMVGQLNVSQALFDHLGNLEVLKLGSGDELELPNWSFVKLPLLLELDLSYIHVLKLHNYTFSGLTALKFLDLRNPVQTIHLPHKVFKPLTSLKELHLEGLCCALYPAFDCTTIDGRLQYVPSLKRFYISKSLISSLGKGFLSLENLEEFYLVNSAMGENCWISDFTFDTFENLKNSPLTRLVLQQCRIKDITPFWFFYLAELQEISLNVKTDVYDNFWSTFINLLVDTNINKIHLSLSSSDAEINIPYPFVVHGRFNETKLRYLELTDTKFDSVEDKTMTMLPKSLKYLNLTHNYIVQFGIRRLKHLENLEILDLSNQVDFKDDLWARNINGGLEFSHGNRPRKQSLSLLYRMDSNGVCPVYKMHEKLQRYLNATRLQCLSLPPRLKILILSNSRLLCNMVPAFCDPFNSLKTLDASYQRDKSCFETRSFWSVLKNLAELEELYLIRNWILEIPKDAFSGLSKLRKLILADNKLLEISFDVKDLISLETLDLSGNSIQYASESFTHQIEEVAWKTNLTLYLNKNPLVCDCKHIDFIAWLIATEVIWNKNLLNCTFENETRISVGRLSEPYEDLKYKCAMLSVIASCSVMFWGLNLVLVGLAYVWHNRQKLRYLVLFGRRTLNPYHPIEDSEVQMEYDVYISYEGDYNVTPVMTLRDFVIYKILPGLEQRGIRVMIREELDPGTRLYEVITQTVRRSRKVLTLLTNDYCQDMWNVFEFNQAVMEGIYTNRQIAIPILFESLKHEKVKEEIQAFLQMEPVHRYSPDLSDRAFIDFLYERIRDTRKFG